MNRNNAHQGSLAYFARKHFSRHDCHCACVGLNAAVNQFFFAVGTQNKLVGAYVDARCSPRAEYGERMRTALKRTHAHTAFARDPASVRVSAHRPYFVSQPRKNFAARLGACTRRSCTWVRVCVRILALNFIVGRQ